MKIVAIILIIAYLMLPALCFGHPCELFSANSLQGAIAADASAEHPSPDTDNCETTCCCAGHVPPSVFINNAYAGLIARLLPYETGLALPRLIDRIFVPPQNHFVSNPS